MSSSWSLRRGATILPDGRVHVAVWAPAAESLQVRVHDGPAAGTHRMETATEGEGVVETVVQGAAAGNDYTFVLPDGRELPDPVSRWQPHGVHGASRIVDPAAFAWSDASWKGMPLADYAIYELHMGTFTREGTFDAAIAELPRLAALGITAIELMPVAQFPGERNWGYDGVHLYAVQHSYGGPDGLKRLVDAAHGHGLAVVLDVVYNHLGPEGNYLDAFGPYFTDRYQTPWGRAVNYDGPHSDGVRRHVIDNACHWIHEYHVDALRLDAVHGIFDFGALHLLQELTDRVHDVGTAAGRTVVVIAESDLNDPRLIEPAVEGGYGMDAQWADDFHHAVHAAITGETSGYYSDFGGTERVADSLREPFVYAGSLSAHRKRRHGASSAGRPRAQFIVSVQNHDQVGNRAAGDRFGTLIPPDRQRVAAALLLLSPYVPMLFMGEEYGETNPFQYFISHSDPGLVEAVRKGRRDEFASFGWGDEVPDPQAAETFVRSRLDTAKAAGPPHAGIQALYTDLLLLRKAEASLRPGGSPVEVGYDSDGIISLDRAAGWRALFNLSDVEHSVRLSADAAAWTLHLTTDDERYGGAGRSTSRDGGEFMLPAWSAALFQRQQ
ncbi:MAG: malto-oligosyltrehalose trehalohydrolase [Gemmatimonadaceae bacterium]|nr:malto-oligosyltrehalose trehalohydrolase [Gemmatimonadaceae bacterium]